MLVVQLYLIIDIVTNEKNDFFNSLQYQLSNKVERPARLELIINEKLNINKNGILFLENELITEIINYKFYIPLL